MIIDEVTLCAGSQRQTRSKTLLYKMQSRASPVVHSHETQGFELTVNMNRFAIKKTHNMALGTYVEK